MCNSPAGSQGSSSGSAERSRARKPSDQVLVSKAPGDAHTEGVAGEHITRQTQQTSHPLALAVLRTDASGSRRPQHRAAHRGTGWQHSPGRATQGRPQHCPRRTPHLTGTTKAPPNLNSRHSKTAAGAHLPPPRGMRSRGLGREPQLLPGQAAEGIWDIGTTAPSPPAGPPIPSTRAARVPSTHAAPRLRAALGCRCRGTVTPASRREQPGKKHRNGLQRRLQIVCLGLQLNFRSPLAPLPATVQHGHHAARTRPPGRMRPWKMHSRHAGCLPLRLPGSRCRAGPRAEICARQNPARLWDRPARNAPCSKGATGDQNQTRL